MPTTSSAFRPLRPPRNLTSELITRLTDEITAGNLAPGTRLPTEQEMMATFGVSRTVVREAIAVLRAEGLVETRQGSGAFVSVDPGRRPFRIDPEGLQSLAEVLNVMELRIAVESEAAGLAAERRTKADLARMDRTIAAFRKAIERGETAVDADYDFHAAIGRATGNTYFSQFLGFLGRFIIPRQTIHVDAEDADSRRQYLEGVLKEHLEIRRTIGDGEMIAARAAMRTHLEHGVQRYKRLAGQSAARR
ncbi:FadR/GntR family transcriptional regulator [Microbaculum marinum]|uniref:FadR/GntR family transcriptional regulator n=1 Tax=Microbaculum marinum TaxID=1764581 RepID=A0AAW9RQU7_9HYPH